MAGEWSGPKWTRQLGRLADLNGETDPLKIRQRILENLDTLCDAALCRTRTYGKNNAGELEVYEVPDPDLKTALGAQLAGARMLGVDAEIKVNVDTRDIDELLSRARKALRNRKEQADGDAAH